MNVKTIEYALNNLKTISDDNDVKFHKVESGKKLGIYVEFASGRNVSLSTDEIYYQAEEYLQHEREYVIRQRDYFKT